MGSDFKKQNCLYHTCGLVIANLHTFYDFHDENKENVKNHTLFSSTCQALPQEAAALKHGIRNSETESRKQKWKRNTESNINNRKFKNFTLHNIVQSKDNLFYFFWQFS